jgi:hypothetical protein
MMISTILIEAWDLYAIAFVLIFIKNESLAVSVLSLIGFLSAKFILPEMYGYVEQEEVIEEEDLAAEAPGGPAGHAAAM